MPPWDFHERQHPLSMTNFRRPVALHNHRQTDTSADRGHHLLPRIPKYQSGVSLDQRGIRYAPYPVEGAVLGYIMPPSSPYGANQPSHQAPPPPDMAALVPIMILLGSPPSFRAANNTKDADSAFLDDDCGNRRIITHPSISD